MKTAPNSNYGWQTETETENKQMVIVWTENLNFIFKAALFEIVLCFLTWCSYSIVTVLSQWQQ